MNEQLQIAETVRRACIEVAIRAYEGACLSGLRPEGRWAYVVDAMRGFDLHPLLVDPDAAPDNRRMIGSKRRQVRTVGPDHLPRREEGKGIKKQWCRYCKTPTTPWPGQAGRPTVCSICWRPYD